ncbi:GL13760 [Drosophila persimilis]|uniref:GL13760 n=3 Tax=Drosophila persimilis TaxID=7234 RepID=B4GNV3_DROPE|nr:GL13760 [Drosophila persimilis]
MFKCTIRLVNLVMQLFTVTVEIVALVYLIMLLYSQCILGGEYYLSVIFSVYSLPVITVQSVVFVLCRLCCFTVGLDPIAMTFNLASGMVCIGSSLTMLVAMIFHCGNEYQYMFFLAGGFGLLAGILHLVNALICNKYMPRKEWTYTKPSKQGRKRMEESILYLVP